MVIAGYTRVSDAKLKTDGERRQDIKRQEEKIKNYCKFQNLPEPIFFNDDNLSAFKDDYNSRPQFIRLLHEVKANRVQHIIVEDMTRWSRRIEDGLKTLREVTEKSKITSLAEGELGVTIPEQWFKTAIGFLMAEWSSRITSYKVKSGMDKRLTDETKKCKKCGKIHLGRIPEACKKGEGNFLEDN
jgi:DNA invertase Pin-like site-specific DNA recombinase